MYIALIVGDVVGAFVVLWFFLTAEKERQNAAAWLAAALIGYGLTFLIAMGICRQTLKLDPVPGILISMLVACAVSVVNWFSLSKFLPSGRGRGPREAGELSWSIGHIVVFALLGALVTVNHQSEFWNLLFQKFFLFFLPAFCMCDGFRLRRPLTSLWVCTLAASVYWLAPLAGLGKGAPTGDILMAMLVTSAVAAALGGLCGWIAVTRE